MHTVETLKSCYPPSRHAAPRRHCVAIQNGILESAALVLLRGYILVFKINLEKNRLRNLPLKGINIWHGLPVLAFVACVYGV